MKLLLGITDDGTSFDALEETLGRVQKTGDTLTVAVIETGADVDADELEARVEDALAEAGVDAAIRRISDDPGSGLVTVADSEGFDRIVLGGGERSPLGKITISETAEFVLLNTETTVTLVR